MKLETLRKRLRHKNPNQLGEYCRHNMKWTKQDLIDLLLESGTIVPTKITWESLVWSYFEEIIDIIIETYEGA